MAANYRLLGACSSINAASAEMSLRRLQSSKKLSVVVPCYNEAQSIPKLVERLANACEQCVDDDYELVLVNDGSTDATWTEILRLSRKRPQIVGVDLARNHGHQLALTAGLSIGGGERILIIDADLQDPPELLPEMMDRLIRALMWLTANVFTGTGSPGSKKRLQPSFTGCYGGWPTHPFPPILAIFV